MFNTSRARELIAQAVAAGGTESGTREAGIRFGAAYVASILLAEIARLTRDTNRAVRDATKFGERR